MIISSSKICVMSISYEVHFNIIIKMFSVEIDHNQRELNNFFLGIK